MLPGRNDKLPLRLRNWQQQHFDAHITELNSIYTFLLIVIVRGLQFVLDSHHCQVQEKDSTSHENCCSFDLGVKIAGWI